MGLSLMVTNSKSSSNTAVILISHGSTLPHAEKTFSEIKAKFIQKSGLPSEIGYMKVSHPSIAEAIEILKNNNPNLERIIALPVFLAEGIHTKIDIPILLGLNAQEQDPRCPDGNYPPEHYLSIAEKVNFNGEIELLPPIGADDQLLKIIHKRINENLTKTDNKLGIILISHGSRLNYNKEFITELYNKFKKTTKSPSTFGFMELSKPSIPEAITKLTDENDINQLIVIPIFIAHGKHTTHDIPHILGLIESHEQKHHHTHDHNHDLTPINFKGEILYTNPIEADDILVDVLVSKAKEIL